MLDRNVLQQNLDQLGISLSAGAMAQLEHFAALLAERNQTMNLTAITSPQDMAVKHFADSLSILPYLPQDTGLSVIDVGTGGGFPGIPLLIARPDLHLTLLDGTKKKLDFLQEALIQLGLSARVCHARAEEAGRDPAMREQFSVCVSRAVAGLSVLSEYCLPLVAPGGIFIAMKGANAQAEIVAARHAIPRLGGSVMQAETFQLGADLTRIPIIVKKISQTPTKYPRASSQIAKKPL